MVTVPAAMAVTTPAELTVATVDEEVLHVKAALVAFEGVTVVASV